VLWALGDYAGSRYDGFFESALGLYSTFAELKRGVDRPMYFLVDPVEDDPHRSWPIYKRNYEMCVVAMLHHHWVDHYEVMPWPDRIYLPGFTMGSGTPGPSDYLTQLMAVQTVLDEMPGVESKPSPNDQGLGLLFSDTASWEIQGPQGPSFDPFHGLYLPFVKDGVMVRTPWLERVTEPGYLDEFKVLLLTYDNQKPVRREIHTALLEWVNNGGHLVFIGGQSAYDEVGAWWNEAGYEAPVAALLDEAGVPVDTLLRRQVERLRLPGDGTGFDADLAVTLYDLAGEAEEAVAADREGLVGFRADIGAGSLTVSGTPSGWAARSAEGAAFLKGPFNAEGAFVDLFDPAYPIVSDPTYPKASSVLLKRVDAEPAGELPKLLFSSYRLVYSDAQPHQLQAVIEGPAETLAAMRVVSPGDRDRIALAEAVDAAGEAVPVVHKYDPDSHSSLVQFEYDPEGVALRLSW
jgi:hypothetical protein